MNHSWKATLPLLFSAALATSLVAGCHNNSHDKDNDTEGATSTPKKVAVAMIKPAAGQSVSGSVRFTEVGNGPVTVIADIDGLTPGEHGFHIHEKGDLSAPDLASVGPHYNPEGHQHAGPHDAEHHAGDLGNITADASGHAHAKITINDVTIDGNHNPIIGRSVVVHAGTDNLKSQPAGDSGKKIAAGIIQMAP